MERVFGFEILPAPFVVSHLQIGLMLRQLGAPLDSNSDERAGVYLTNALTGWEPPKQPKNELPLFPELLEERDAANRVKREAPIIVIIGNPPYNAFAGTSPEEEGGLVEPYKEGLTRAVKDGGWGIKKFNLDDLYVRFFRIAERRIVKSGKGVVSYISNFSYIGDPSFVVMRKRFLDEFDRIWIDCMNGDSRETGKLTPDGKPDPSVFSTEQTSVGIRVGTAICVMVRKENREKKPTVRFQHYWGVTKRQDLLDSLNLKLFDRRYETAKPTAMNRYTFKPENVSREYNSWPLVVDLCLNEPISGIQEMRHEALIDLDADELTRRVSKYFSDSVTWEEIVALGSGLSSDAGGFNAKQARTKLLGREVFEKNRIRRYALYPFDTRWCYYTLSSTLWNRPRPNLVSQVREGNAFHVTRMIQERPKENMLSFLTANIPDYHLLRPNIVAIPILYHCEQRRFAADLTSDMFCGTTVDQAMIVNVSLTAREYLNQLGITDPDRDAETAGVIWMHALAIGYSPLYLSENADGIRQDWPRIPLPNAKKALLKSAELGRRIAALLDTEKPVESVTCGDICPELKSVAVISKVGGGSLNPNIGELDMTAGWGHGGKDGVCMPGKGKIIERKQNEKKLEKLFGETTLDIYLNDVAYWANVPRTLWDYHIGGYQVIKKWLSYREKTMLGRGLKVEEAEYVQRWRVESARSFFFNPLLTSIMRASRTTPGPGRRVLHSRYPEHKIGCV